LNLVRPERFELPTTAFEEVYSKHLTLSALDATDLALSKLERNLDRDRQDFERLFRAGLINLTVLEQRYHEELRPYLAVGDPGRHDLTLSLWLAIAKSIKS
jgi:Nucleotidyltransferase of unknown function (DUF6036)